LQEIKICFLVFALGINLTQHIFLVSFCAVNVT